jgi:hypothetical protein
MLVIRKIQEIKLQSTNNDFFVFRSCRFMERFLRIESQSMTVTPNEIRFGSKSSSGTINPRNWRF